MTNALPVMDRKAISAYTLLVLAIRTSMEATAHYLCGKMNEARQNRIRKGRDRFEIALSGFDVCQHFPPTFKFTTTLLGHRPDPTTSVKRQLKINDATSDLGPSKKDVRGCALWSGSWRSIGLHASRGMITQATLGKLQAYLVARYPSASKDSLCTASLELSATFREQVSRRSRRNANASAYFSPRKDFLSSRSVRRSF
uniref:Uncharacterized protein n=1 Tax=Trichuris muris TaxID=70415 RepID=A0A5S6QZ28_TRIMR